MRCFKVNRAIYKRGKKSKHVDVTDDFSEMSCCGSCSFVFGVYICEMKAKEKIKYVILPQNSSKNVSG